MEKRHARIERGITKLVVPHEKGEVTFAYPSIGPNNYTEVGKEILKQEMNVPTGDYMASLIHTAYCNDSVKNEPEYQNIREIMKNKWLWVFNRNLWTKDGVYVLQDSKAIGRSQPLSQNDLEKMLKGSKEVNGVRFSKDKNVRFAEKGSYQLENHTPESLAKDGFVIASYGIEGAEKLGEVSSKFKVKPYVYGVEKDTSEQRVSALYLNSFGDRLNVYGDVFGDYGDCHAFGVWK
ncbi:MAG: hypothetical protein AABY15_03530 [Nanoarchaeota archaeon]